MCNVALVGLGSNRNTTLYNDLIKLKENDIEFKTGKKIKIVGISAKI